MNCSTHLRRSSFGQAELPRSGALRAGHRPIRRGLTLAELLVSSTILVIIAGSMATLAMAVHAGNSHTRGQIVAAQHARVITSRIEAALGQSVASELFPACLVVTEPAGGEELPSALVVWSPMAAPADPTGLPRIGELVLFAPDPANPSHLLEIRSPDETTSVPSPGDTAAWRTLVDRLRASQTVQRQRLTDRLRTAPLSGEWRSDISPEDLRGVVRFRRIVAPSEEEWAEYRSGERAWHELAWPLNAYRTRSGTRVVVCHTEVHLIAGDLASQRPISLPFFGSATLSYELRR